MERINKRPGIFANTSACQVVLVVKRVASETPIVPIDATYYMYVCIYEYINLD